MKTLILLWALGIAAVIILLGVIIYWEAISTSFFY